jgi:hypothetical protein
LDGCHKVVNGPDFRGVRSFKLYALWDNENGYEVHNKYYSDDNCTEDNYMYEVTGIDVDKCSNYVLAKKSDVLQLTPGIYDVQFLGDNCPSKKESLDFNDAIFYKNWAPLNKCYPLMDNGISFIATDCTTDDKGVVYVDFHYFFDSTNCTGKSKFFTSRKAVPSSDLCFPLEGDSSVSFMHTFCIKN